MNQDTQSPEPNLALAQEFIRAVEAKDLDGVARTLADDADQLFLSSNDPRTREGIAKIVAGAAKKGICVADVRGKDEVLAYTAGLVNKFTPLVWLNHQWTLSPSGQVFFSGSGGMAVARTGKPYRNNYVTRFDIVDGKIVRLVETANAFLYVGLRIAPNAAELRAFARAIPRLIPGTKAHRAMI
jgi:ketosteroid isomerase-like protein